MSAFWRSDAARAEVLARYEALLAQWPAPAERRHVPTSLGETFVISAGPAEAPPVILLHGSAANSASWMGDIAGLAQRYRVHAVDMPGEPGFSATTRAPLAGGAHGTWLGEVMDGLDAPRAALVGISLGGWVALDFATARAERVTALALLCPGGIGAQRNILPWVLPLMLLGPWGRRRILARLRGGAAMAGTDSPAARAFAAMMELTFATFRPRREPLPRFDDAALGRLAMPVLAILGGADAMLDSAETRDRLSRCVPHAAIDWLPDAGHVLAGHGARIGAFLERAVGAPD